MSTVKLRHWFTAVRYRTLTYSSEDAALLFDSRVKSYRPGPRRSTGRATPPAPPLAPPVPAAPPLLPSPKGDGKYLSTSLPRRLRRDHRSSWPDRESALFDVAPCRRPISSLDIDMPGSPFFLLVEPFLSFGGPKPVPACLPRRRCPCWRSVPLSAESGLRVGSRAGLGQSSSVQSCSEIYAFTARSIPCLLPPNQATTSSKCSRETASTSSSWSRNWPFIMARAQAVQPIRGLAASRAKAYGVMHHLSSRVHVGLRIWYARALPQVPLQHSTLNKIWAAQI